MDLMIQRLKILGYNGVFKTSGSFGCVFKATKIDEPNVHYAVKFTKK